MKHGFEVVSVGIDHERAIVVRVVLRANAGRTIVLGASGERFDPSGFTAAHRSLPFGSKVRVTNTSTGASVVVRINDRGPFSRGRLIDVSQAAARQLGLIGPGSGRVSLAVLSN